MIRPELLVGKWDYSAAHFGCIPMTESGHVGIECEPQCNLKDLKIACACQDANFSNVDSH